jgi:hypothetical protein
MSRDDALKASLGLDDEYLDEETTSEDDGVGGDGGGYVPSTLSNGAGVNGASPVKGGGGADRITMPSATNDELQHEVAALRDDVAAAEERTRVVEARAADAAAVRANALKFLQAAEDHVGLLLNESRNKLENLARENEKVAAGEHVAAAGAGAGDGAAAGAGFGGGLGVEERQVGLCTSRIQLTHSLKAVRFQPLSL